MSRERMKGGTGKERMKENKISCIICMFFVYYIRNWILMANIFITV